MSERRTFVPKGWGFEDWIVNKDAYCGKLLFVKKGRKCSWHYHKVKDETFYVASGVLLLRFIYPTGMERMRKHGLTEVQACGDEQNYETTILQAGDHFHVPVGMYHQFEGVIDTQLFEFSTKHEDSDSYRVIKGD